MMPGFPTSYPIPNVPGVTAAPPGNAAIGRNLRPAGLGGSYATPQRTIPGQSGFGQALRGPHTNPNMAQPAALSAPQGGVRPGNNMMGGPSVGAPQGPSLEQIQSEMARRQVGGQLGPRNGALAGYMMS